MEEDRKANIIASSVVLLLIITIIVARFILRISRPFFLVCGAAVAAILAVFAVEIIRRRFSSRRKQLESEIVSERRQLRIEYSFLRKVAGVPTKFKYKELEDATDGFRSLLGRGASASVFKGILSDGTQVAVKRIDGIDQERSEKEFKSEVAAISSVQHVNLVRLIGYCSVQSGPRFLVYDFFSNGSLDNWIFPRKSEITKGSAGVVPGGCLPWELRCRVALDVAKALSYLHHDCRSCILHLDIKPENVLLNERHQALVTDFGFSKLKGKEESRVITMMRGTRGYLAPEWILENGISEKCDVYSYGMLLLEIIGGQRNLSVIDFGNSKSERKFQCFAKLASEKLREGKVMEIVDGRLMEKGGIEERVVRRMVRIALWCIQEKPKRRPSMGAVVEMLEGRVEVEEPPETEILVVDLLGMNDGKRSPGYYVDKDTGSTSTASCSFGISVLSGR